MAEGIDRVRAVGQAEAAMPYVFRDARPSSGLRRFRRDAAATGDIVACGETARDA